MGSEAEASETIASLRAGLRAQEQQLRGLLAARDVVVPRGWEASHGDGEGGREAVGAPSGGRRRAWEEVEAEEAELREADGEEDDQEADEARVQVTDLV